MEERVIRGSDKDIEAVTKEIEAEGGRVLHRCGSTLVILDNDRWSSIQRRVADRAQEPEARLERITAASPDDLSGEELLAAAFAMRQTSEFKAAKRSRPNEGVEWAGLETLQ